jgi:NADH dehydrogenase
VIGDLALVKGRDSRPLPALAPVAIQQGRYVAARIAERLTGENWTRPAAAPPFRYRDLGAMATIGRAAAVANFGRFRLTGYPAWFFWLFVHLMSPAQRKSRLLGFVQWAWNYFTRSRSARPITDSMPVMKKKDWSEGGASLDGWNGIRARRAPHRSFVPVRSRDPPSRREDG